MATLTGQGIKGTGNTETLASADVAGDKFKRSSGSNTFLKVNNAANADITVTFVAKEKCNQGALHNKEVKVTKESISNIGPIEDRFVDEDGYVNVTYSSVTSVKVGVFTPQA